MSSAILNITFDCADSGTIARFWSAVTGWPLHEEDLRPGHQEYSVGPSAEDGIRLYFAGVPEPKIVKNRIHLDLIPRGDQQQEIARLELFQSKVSFRRVAGPGCGLLRRRRPDLPGMPGICPEAGDMFTVSGVIAPEIADIYERRPLWTGPAGARGTRSGEGTAANRAPAGVVRSAGATHRELTLFRNVYLVKLGASVADTQPDGVAWVILADPEGNELCLEGGGD